MSTIGLETYARVEGRCFRPPWSRAVFAQGACRSVVQPQGHRMSAAGYDSPELEELLIKARKGGKNPSEVVDASDADLAEAARFHGSGMVVFSMYHSTGWAHGTGNDDAPWFARFGATQDPTPDTLVDPGA